jgi:hypothetical protein
MAAETAAPPAVRYGFDERIREEYYDTVPLRDGTYVRGGENNYLRFRTRLWGEADVFSNVTASVRAVNEFRIWDQPDPSGRPQRSTYEFPDEVIFDRLYVEVRNLFGAVDVRLGRQDLSYGNGKVIYEGTPEDGSRTYYVNAAKATWRATPSTRVDVVGIYNPPTDALAINASEDRDLTGFTSDPDDVTESGAFAYLSNSSFEDLPFEAYAAYKRESHWQQPATPDAAGGFSPPPHAWQTLDEAGGVIRNPALDLCTVGTRLMPLLTEELRGNLEAALQAGRRDDEAVLAYMLDAFLTYQVPIARPAGTELEGGVYLLSGDDPGTDMDEGWNPLWARYTQDSELYYYCWGQDGGAGRWSNLVMPRVRLSARPWKWLKTTLKAAYLWALHNDTPAGAGTDGNGRGFLACAKGEFTVKEGLLRRTGTKDKLAGHLQVEVLQPGDYYPNDDTALFARWEFSYTF